jgi:hypothetical protein
MSNTRDSAVNYSADSIRVVHPLLQVGGGGSIPTSALQLLISRTGLKEAVALNKEWHSRLPIYNTGFCLNGRPYWAHFENIAYAVAIWSNPVAPALPQEEWLELRRFAIASDAPRNTASRMLAVMARLIRREMPKVLRLISYQDEEVHSGTIYKAAGWTIGARHLGGSWNRPNAKNLNGRPRTRPDLNGATGPKIRWEKIIRT